MQQSALTLRQKLIDAVDERYHVKDMAAIVEVLGTLERLPVTKEMLETTRLGKTVNEFRKKINNEKLAKRAKALVKKWRDAVLVTTEPQQSGRSLNGSTLVGDVQGPARLQQSSALSSLQGYNSSTSSPKLQTSSSKVSPAGSNNSNSLSPRVLTSFNSINSSSNNRNGSNSNVNSSESLHRNATLGAAQHHGSAIHSPLNSASLKTSSPSSASYLINKSRSSPYANPTYSQSSTKSPALPASYSYAPNSENVAKTNAANKRYRKDEDSGISVSSGPPAKKPRINGTGGTLDDPLLLDEHSKDSIISRTSDHSDGSSKPVSLVSSGAVLSAAPSPLAGNLDSDISPPLSVESGANNNNKALITNEDKLSPTPPSISGDENSRGVGIAGAVVENAVNELPSAQPKRGRKRKKQEPMDAATLLREQIAKAQAEGKIRIQERRPMDEIRRRSPPVKPAPPAVASKQPQLSAISKEDPLIKNEFVEKYLESQTELRARMERQALDAVANNEIKFDDDEESQTEPKKPIEEDDSKKKKKKDKKKKEGSAEKSGPVFPSEIEILSRLPPIDPDILAEFKSFTFYEDTKEDVVNESHPDNKETDNLQTKTASLSSNDQQSASNGGVTNLTVPAAIEPPKNIFATKIDWGDSDDDEDFEEVKTPGTTIKEDQVDSAPVAVTVLPLDPSEEQPIPEKIKDEEEFMLTDEVTFEEAKVLIEEPIAVPLREVEESEVERLHSEQINNLNGNQDKDGKFREWQETIAMESINGDLLHILPYTIIDF